MNFMSYPISHTGVPILDYLSIDEYVDEVLSRYAPQYTRAILPFDIKDFARRGMGCRIAGHVLSRDGSVEAASFFSEALPRFYDEGIETTMRVKPMTIVMDPKLFNDPYRARYILAHECGHLMLHTTYYRTHHIVMGGPPPREKDVDDYLTMEIQAHWFACCLMMNRVSALSFWENMEPYLKSRFPGDELSAANYAYGAGAAQFQVTRYAVQRRLRELHLYDPNIPRLAP